MSRQLWSSVIGMLCIAAAQVALIPVAAQAEPDQPPPPDQSASTEVPAVTLDWQRLGMTSSLYFGEDNVTQSLKIPVPEGLSPTTLTGALHSVSNIPAGYVEAQTTDGRFLGTIPIPDRATGRTSSPFTVDIGSVPIVRHAAQLNFVLRRVGGGDICDPPPTLVMSDFSVAFGGDSTPPTTIEGFFPSVAPTVNVYVDPKPTAAEKLTTLSFVAALTSSYRPAPVTINVQPLARTEAEPPIDNDKFTRAVVIRDADNSSPGVNLVTREGSPYLLLAGKGDKLVEQVRLFQDKLIAVAQDTKVTVTSAQTGSRPGASTMTFDELHATGSAKVFGQSFIPLDLGSGLFERAKPGSVDVHLQANYTPVDDTEKGTMAVTIGGVVVRTVRLDTTGHVETEFTIPADVAARDQTLGLSVTYEQSAGTCTARSIPMDFQVDPMSTASVKSGGVALGGFAALPTGFVPTFQVAMDDTDPAQLAHAAAIVGLIQRMSSVVLKPDIVTLEEASTSGTSALIIANARSVHAQKLDPPIDTAGDLSSIDLPAPVVANISTGIASLQSYAQNNRTVVLVTTSGNWEMASAIFNYLSSLTGWQDLSGDVLVSGQGGNPQTLTIRTDRPTLDTRQSGLSVGNWVELGGAALLLLGAVAGVVYLLTRRIRRSRDTTTSSTTGTGQFDATDTGPLGPR